MLQVARVQGETYASGCCGISCRYQLGAKPTKYPLSVCATAPIIQQYVAKANIRSELSVIVAAFTAGRGLEWQRSHEDGRGLHSRDRTTGFPIRMPIPSLRHTL